MKPSWIVDILVVGAIAGVGVSAQRASPPEMRQAVQLDLSGQTQAARVILQRLIDGAADPAATAAPERAMAMSFAFDGDCANTIAHEERVIAYWKTREAVEPQNAFYQEGEMANEAARVCIDSGDLDRAERWYRTGTDLGLREPEPKTHPASLWRFRLAHALGRLAARRGDAAEASKQIEAARRALGADPKMAQEQQRFLPYLIGYIGLYTGDLARADHALTEAVGEPGNTNDPFMRYLLAMTYEKLGRTAEARAEYEKAFAMATAHNPPAAFVRRSLRGKIDPAHRSNR
jgi:Flp pilus assembly protein TadD